MHTRHPWIAALIGLCVAAGLQVGARAEPAPEPAASERPGPAARPAVEKTEPGEPAVRWTVIEDDGAQIDELKVRGMTRRITVTPKVIGKPYEIIPSSGARDQTEGPNGFNGAVGKRVWPVLSF